MYGGHHDFVSFNISNIFESLISFRISLFVATLQSQHKKAAA